MAVDWTSFGFAGTHCAQGKVILLYRFWRATLSGGEEFEGWGETQGQIIRESIAEDKG